MLSLQLLGGTSLSDSNGQIPPRATQRRRLAVLVVLATARGRAVSRDKLIAMLWPEADAERARHLLADTTYVLRSSLGDDIIVGVADDLCLNLDRIQCDLVEFERALEARDLTRAADCYAGPFLDGFHVAESSEFERWSDTMRHQIAERYHAALETLATLATKDGNHAESVKWWKRLAAEDRFNSRVALGLMAALASAGDTAGAIRFARVHEGIVRGELEDEPDPSISAFAEQLRVSPPAVTIPVVGQETRSASAAPPPEMADAPRARKRWRGSGAVALGVVVLGAALGSMALRGRSERARLGAEATQQSVAGADVAPPTIAVLPFRSGTDQQDLDLASGLTDEITYDLTRVRGLRVISGAATREARLAATSRDVAQPRYLVEGAVRRQKDSVRITAHLTDARDGTHRWSEEYAKAFRLDQIFAVEDSIALAVASAVRATLGLSQPAPLPSRHVPTMDAYELYRRGRFFWARRTLEDTRRSIEYFTRAIALDSLFAPAWAGLADAYVVLGIGNVVDTMPNEPFARARVAAITALRLDSTEADAHSSLGYITLLYDLRWNEADRHFARALELGPSRPAVHLYRIVLYEWLGRFEDAEREARAVVTLDYSLVGNIELGRALFFERRYDDAIARFKLALEQDSTSFRAHLHLGQVYEQQRRYDAALRELTASRILGPRSSRPIALLVHAMASSGDVQGARRILAELHARAVRQYVPALDFAIAYVGLGDKDQTFAWLDSARADRSIRPYLRDPTFDSVRSDARYAALMHALGLSAAPSTVTTR